LNDRKQVARAMVDFAHHRSLALGGSFALDPAERSV
jgi:hypothetical protein